MLSSGVLLELASGFVIPGLVFTVPGMEEQWATAVPLEMGKAIYLILLYCYPLAGVPSTSLVALPEKA